MSRLDKYSRKPRVRMASQSSRKLNPLANLVVLLGHPMALIGWLVLAMTSIFVWIFPMQSDLWSLVLMRGELVTTSGQVTATNATTIREGQTDRRPQGTMVWEHEFMYTDAQGTRHTGTGYTLGSTHSPGNEVEVEYRADRPDIARITGARMYPFGVGVAFVFIFPLAALVILVIGLRLGFKRMQVLSNGKLASGKLVDMKPTNTKINNQTVHLLRFSFEVDGQEHMCLARTHRTHLLTDDEEEQIIYNASNPARSMPVDLLPSGLEAQDDGRIIMRNPARVLLPLLLPAVVIGANIAAAYWVLG